jgi:hypothetical protein
MGGYASIQAVLRAALDPPGTPPGLNGIQEVGGSTPLGSTNKPPALTAGSTKPAQPELPFL